ERFQLTAHHEMKEMVVYDPILARADGKRGPGLDGEEGSGVRCSLGFSLSIVSLFQCRTDLSQRTMRRTEPRTDRRTHRRTMDHAPWTMNLAACALILALCIVLRAADHTGQVTFTGLPVPGATVTATQGTTVVTATSNEEGFYRLTGLAEGVWTVKIEMSGFAPLVKEVTMAEGAPPVTFELTLLG